MYSAWAGFEHIESKREKKNIMKSHVYLDALITLFRIKGNQLQKPIDVLASDFFKGLNIDALRSILEKFTEVQQVNRGEARRNENPEDLPDIKFVCTKELEKILLCNIIGVSVHLAFNQRLRASVLCKTLKKSVGDLKNYFKEVGLNVEATKDNRGEPDLQISIPKRERTKSE